MPRTATRWAFCLALAAIFLLPANAFAGVSEGDARKACQERIRSKVPGAKFPSSPNHGDGKASHYFTWTAATRVESPQGRVPASCVVNLETMKIYVTVSGKDLPAAKYSMR